MLSGLLKNEQMVILKTTFLKKILILYAKTIFSLRGLKMKNSTWNVICTIGQTLRIFPKIHFFHVLVLLIYLHVTVYAICIFCLFSICFSWRKAGMLILTNTSLFLPSRSLMRLILHTWWRKILGIEGNWVLTF